MRCVVIGSGCSGLTSAIIMAKNGYDVTVVEKSIQPAPLLQGFERKGFYFDTGVHCLSGLDANGPLRSLLEYLNVYTPLTYSPFDNLQSFSIYFPDGTIWKMPQGYEALFDALVEKFPSEREGIRTFLDRVRAISFDFQYTGDFQAIATHEASQQSLQNVMDELLTNPQLKICLGILNNLFCGLADAEVSFAFFASSIGTYFQSSGTFSGGGKALFNAMKNELASLGGHIIYNNGAEKVVIDDYKQARGVILEDGAYFESDIIIATCHPSALPALFPEKSLRKIRRTYYQELESTTSLIGVFGYVTTPIQQLEQSNILIAPKCAPLTPNGILNVPLEERQMLITSSHSCSNGTGVSILIPADYAEWASFEGEKKHQRRKGYRTKKKQITEDIISLATQYLPELKGNFTVLSISTPLTIKDYCHAPNGAAYGVKRSLFQLTPTPAFPIKNILLSGQAIVGPGILGAMTSGFVTCGEMLGHTHLQNEILKCS